MSSLEILSWLSIGLGLATALVIALDERKHPQSMRIMNIVWPVTGLYFPLIGIWFYRSMGRTMAVDAPKAKGQHAQYVPIRSMQQVPPAQAIWDAVRADTLSLIAFEVGMFGWMAFARYVLLPEPVAPNSVVFWFMMQIGMIFGFLTTYPANWLLVKWGIKSGM
jgi:hypothetical protein